MSESRAAAHPIELVVNDNLERSRLTVFFRLLLAIPHLLWLWLWGIAAYVAALVNWIATLVAGRSPEALHGFLERFDRYQTHVYAYLFLVADPFPGFGGREGSYPVDLRVAAPQPQNRLTVLFRLLLAIPALLLATVLQYVMQLVAFLGWFYALFTGRMSEGMRNLNAYALRYLAQTYGYVFMLTGRYPSLSGGPT